MYTPEGPEDSFVERRRSGQVSLRRDRIGRSIARVIGVAVMAAGVVGALSNHPIRDRLVGFITCVSFGSWIFYVARTAQGPAADDSQRDS